MLLDIEKTTIEREIMSIRNLTQSRPIEDL